MSLKLFGQFCKSKQKLFHVRNLSKTRKSKKNQVSNFRFIEEIMNLSYILTAVIFASKSCWFRQILKPRFVFKSAHKKHKRYKQKNSWSSLIFENIQTHEKKLSGLLQLAVVFFLLQRQLRKNNLPNSKTTIWYVPVETLQSYITVFTKLHRAKIMYCFFKAKVSWTFLWQKTP